MEGIFFAPALKTKPYSHPNSPYPGPGRSSADLDARAVGNHGGCEFAMNRIDAMREIYARKTQWTEAAGKTQATAAFGRQCRVITPKWAISGPPLNWKQEPLQRLSTEDRAAQWSLNSSSRWPPSCPAGACRKPKPSSPKDSLRDRSGDLAKCTLGWNRRARLTSRQHNSRRRTPLSRVLTNTLK